MPGPGGLTRPCWARRAKKLQEILSGGYINYRASGQSCRLVIKDNVTLLNVVNLINGCMRTPKIEALHRLIEWLNMTKKLTKPLVPLGLDTSPLSSNNWLSGILDADCHFYFNWKLDKNGFPTSLEYYMRISQKREYSKESSMNKDFLPIMASIAKFLDTKVNLIDRMRKHVSYRELAYLVRANKINSKTILLNYLEEHPLYSYKHFAVINFKQIHELSLTKTYKTLDSNNKLFGIQQRMKPNTGVYTWDHLNNFPTN